jgi:hypothetical protein
MEIYGSMAGWTGVRSISDIHTPGGRNTSSNDGYVILEETTIINYI